MSTNKGTNKGNDPPKKTGAQLWDETYYELAYYFKQYGHSQPGIENTELRDWAEAQRRKIASLTKEQITKLDVLKFPWKDDDMLKPNVALAKGVFAAMLAKLKSYIQDHSTCHLPSIYFRDKILGQWVQTVKSTFANGKFEKSPLQPLEKQHNERYDALKELGLFDPPPRRYLPMIAPQQDTGVATDTTRYSTNVDRIKRLKVTEEGLTEQQIAAKHQWWHQMYARLVEFKRRYGICHVPEVFDEEPDLAQWVRFQRDIFREYGKDTDRKWTSAERNQFMMLKDLGFFVESYAEDSNQLLQEQLASLPKPEPTQEVHQSMRDGVFEVMYERLEKYKEEHGNSFVPLSYDKDEELAKWVHDVRKSYTTGSFPGQYVTETEVASKYAKLHAIGFFYDSQHSSHRAINRSQAGQWYKMFARLQAYKAENGHCLVPSRYKTDPPLGKWVHLQVCCCVVLCCVVLWFVVYLLVFCFLLS